MRATELFGTEVAPVVRDALARRASSTTVSTSGKTNTTEG